MLLWLALLAAVVHARSFAAVPEPRMSAERIVFSTTFGDVQMAYFPEVAPVTVAHISQLIRTGCYNSNHFFRVDRGFVAQTADVASGRLVPLSPEQLPEAIKTVPLEVAAGVKHVEGVLSMARSSDPNSGGSSFSVLLGPAPHLDMQYAVFGKVVAGMGTLRKMEGVETVKSGIFVMPRERVTIHSTFVFYVADPLATVATAWSFRDPSGAGAVDAEKLRLQDRVDALATELQQTRERCLPA